MFSSIKSTYDPVVKETFFFSSSFTVSFETIWDGHHLIAVPESADSFGIGWNNQAISSGSLPQIAKNALRTREQSSTSVLCRPSTQWPSSASQQQQHRKLKLLNKDEPSSSRRIPPWRGIDSIIKDETTRLSLSPFCPKMSGLFGYNYKWPPWQQRTGRTKGDTADGQRRRPFLFFFKYLFIIRLPKWPFLFFYPIASPHKSDWRGEKWMGVEATRSSPVTTKSFSQILLETRGSPLWFQVIPMIPVVMPSLSGRIPFDSTDFWSELGALSLETMIEN